MEDRGGALVPVDGAHVTIWRQKSLLQDLTRSLSFMRKDEAQTDLRFIMAGKKVAYAHKAIFAQHSRLLQELFEIADRKQVG